MPEENQTESTDQPTEGSDSGPTPKSFDEVWPQQSMDQAEQVSQDPFAQSASIPQQPFDQPYMDSQGDQLNTQEYTYVQPQMQQGYAQDAYGQPLPDQQVFDGASFDTAGYGQPSYDQSQYGQPQYGQPSYDQPSYGQPMAPQYVQNGSNLGTTPLVLGILSLVAALILGLTFIGPIVGIVLAAIGISKGSKVLKQDPTNGRARGGKITSIIGLILSIIVLIANIALVAVVGSMLTQAMEDPDTFISQMEDLAALDETGELQEQVDDLKEQMNTLNAIESGEGSSASGSSGAIGAGTADGQDGNPGTETSSGTNNDSSSGASVGDGGAASTGASTQGVFSLAVSGDSEADVKALAENVLASISSPTAEQQKSFSEYFNESFDSLVGIQIDDLGLTEDEYVNWATGGFKYQVQGATATETFGMAEATVEVRDFDQFIVAFDEGMSTVNFEEATENAESIDAFYKQIGTIMRDAMAKTETVERTVMVDAVCDGATWSIDESSLRYLYNTLYGLY